MHHTNIIGSGQLASAFKAAQPLENTCIFASGVSHSGCTDEQQFARERKLLVETLTNNRKKFVYFSSCALSAPNYEKNAYYQHKLAMENLIRSLTDQYYIFRLPQLFGRPTLHNTLINFLYSSIIAHKPFTVYTKAFRYVIEITDVVAIVSAFLKFSAPGVTVDIANPHRYLVVDIVKALEAFTGVSAQYTLEEREDGYELDLTKMKNFIQQHDLGLSFSEHYISEKLSQYAQK